MDLISSVFRESMELINPVVQDAESLDLSCGSPDEFAEFSVTDTADEITSGLLQDIDVATADHTRDVRRKPEADSDSMLLLDCSLPEQEFIESLLTTFEPEDTTGGELSTVLLLSSHDKNLSSADVDDAMDIKPLIGLDGIIVNAMTKPGSSNKPHHCNECHKQFRTSIGLSRHAYFVHIGERPHQCPHCDRCFKLLTMLERHLEVHAEPKKLHRCEECDRTFRDSFVLRRHVLKHSGEKRYRCPYCDKGFTEKYNMKRHTWSHTGFKPYRCTVCQCSFREISHLKKHMLVHSVGRPFVCPKCSQRFMEEGHLKRHMSVHTVGKPFKCPNCEQRFSTEGRMKWHVRVHDQENKANMHACPWCERVFRERCNLKRHVVVHTREKQFSCPVCRQKFTQKGLINRHMLIHSGIRPFKCPRCPKRFNQRSLVKRHVLVHSSERPFQCSICLQRFKELNSLRRHLIMSHGSNEPPEEDWDGSYELLGTDKPPKMRSIKKKLCETSEPLQDRRYKKKSLVSDEPPQERSRRQNEQRKSVECENGFDRTVVKRFTELKSTNVQHLPRDVQRRLGVKQKAAGDGIVHRERLAGDQPKCAENSAAQDQLTFATSEYRLSNSASEKSENQAKCADRPQKQARKKQLKNVDCAPTTENRLKRNHCTEAEDRLKLTQNQPRPSMFEPLTEQVLDDLLVIKQEPEDDFDPRRNNAVPISCSYIDEGDNSNSSSVIILSSLDDVTSVANSDTNKMPLSTGGSEKPHKRNRCDQRSFRHHAANHAGGEKPHECLMCHKTFSNTYCLQRHMTVHMLAKPHPCPQCEHSFRDTFDLKRHMLTHTSEKPHRCPLCEHASFRDSVRLRRHMLIHTSDRPHQCPTCHVTFNTRSRLQSHAIIHSLGKPYTCPPCDKTFASAGRLLRHMLLHSGQKPHRCRVCAKCFHQASGLRRHLLTHRRNNPRRCTNCDKIFLWPNQLERHLPGCLGKMPVSLSSVRKYKSASAKRLPKRKSQFCHSSTTCLDENIKLVNCSVVLERLQVINLSHVGRACGLFPTDSGDKNYAQNLTLEDFLVIKEEPGTETDQQPDINCQLTDILNNADICDEDSISSASSSVIILD